jgi:prepilin peptidase CpaA
MKLDHATAALMAMAAPVGVVAMVEDVRRRTLPDWLTVAGLAAGLVYAACHGWYALGMALAGAGTGFLMLLPFHLCRAMGGGDVKLLAAFGAMLGPAGVILAAGFAAVCGGVLAAVALLWRPRTAAIPYAPAIVIGAWMALLGGGA